MEEKNYIEVCGCKLEKELAYLLRVSGIVVCSLTILIEFACTITELVTFKLQSFVLSLYLMLFAIATLFAELRFIECFRSMTFRCLKHVYFVSSYTGRGLFYIFIGTLLFDKAIGYILGVAMILLGITNVAASYLCPDRLPVFADKWPEGQAPPGAAAPVAPAPMAAPTPTPGMLWAPKPPPPRFDPINPFAVLQPAPAAAPPQGPAHGPPGPMAPPDTSAASSSTTGPSTLPAAASQALGSAGSQLKIGVTWLKDHAEHLTPERLELAGKFAKLTQGFK